MFNEHTNNIQVLNNYAGAHKISLDCDMLACFERYRQFLLEYNQKVNLTAITDPSEVLIKHFLDSLLVLDAYDIPRGARVIDVGTGAGFPGVPIKIVRADIKLTLLDSLNKRVRFLELLSDLLFQQDNHCIHARAEQAARQPHYREIFDVAVSRAVAALPALCEYALPFVRQGGVFIALKGADIEDEVSAAQSAIHTTGGKLSRISTYTLPDGSRRSIIIIKKISQTPTKYPRTSVKIAKTPL